MNDSKSMLDIEKASVVEFTVDEEGKVWVNVDGTCRLRIGYAETVIVGQPSPVESEQDLNEAIGGADVLEDDIHATHQVAEMAASEPSAYAMDFGPESEWGNHVAPAIYDNSPALSAYAMDEDGDNHPESAYAMDESYTKPQTVFDEASRSYVMETKPLYTILPGRGIARDGKPTVYIRSEEPMNVSPSEFEEYFRELVDQLNEY